MSTVGSYYRTTFSKSGERVSVPEIICEVNEDKDKIRENIKANVKLGLTQVRPYETQLGKNYKFSLWWRFFK